VAGFIIKVAAFIYYNKGGTSVTPYYFGYIILLYSPIELLYLFMEGSFPAEFAIFI